jgi:NTP pyrophosphatase (non-canonical NTP hydrolase)
METKKEITARISEIDTIINSFLLYMSNGLISNLETRKDVLQQLLKTAGEDIFESVLRSHKILCEIKHMDEKAAYGQNPALYYAAGVSAEAGEMLNDIVKACRNGNDPEAAKTAVASELPDVIIYSAILSHVLDLDLPKLVADKVEIVIQRALSGYYGGPIPGLDNKSPIIESNSELRPFEIIVMDDAGNRRIGDVVWVKNKEEAFKLGSQLYPHDQYPNTDIDVWVPLSTKLSEYDQVPIEERITEETLSIKQSQSNEIKTYEIWLEHCANSSGLVKAANEKLASRLVTQLHPSFQVFTLVEKKFQQWNPALKPWEIKFDGADVDLNDIIWAKNEEQAWKLARQLHPEEWCEIGMSVRKPQTFSVDECYEIPIEERIIEATKPVPQSD